MAFCCFKKAPLACTTCLYCKSFNVLFLRLATLSGAVPSFRKSFAKLRLNFELPKFFELFFELFLFGSVLSAAALERSLLPESECKGRGFFRIHQIFRQEFFKKYVLQHVPKAYFRAQQPILQTFSRPQKS